MQQPKPPGSGSDIPAFPKPPLRSQRSPAPTPPQGTSPAASPQPVRAAGPPTQFNTPQPAAAASGSTVGAGGPGTPTPPPRKTNRTNAGGGGAVPPQQPAPAPATTTMPMPMPTSYSDPNLASRETTPNTSRYATPVMPRRFDPMTGSNTPAATTTTTMGSASTLTTSTSAGDLSGRDGGKGGEAIISVASPTAYPMPKPLGNATSAGGMNQAPVVGQGQPHASPPPAYPVAAAAPPTVSYVPLKQGQPILVGTPMDIRNTSGAVPATATTSALQTSSPRVHRRKTALKTVPLTRAGHLVVDLPVPGRYLGLCNETTGKEFTHTRYTAVTCDPDVFGNPSSGYELRARSMGRDTELFIVMTMYNEDERLFGKTMMSVMKNVAYLCSPRCPRSWGPIGWTNVVVCIVADGRQKIQKRVLNSLGLMGVYQDGVTKTEIDGKPVTAHIFEYTTQVCVDEDLNIKGHREGLVPVQ
ncbi:Chitin synthase, class 1, partial [Quaeritorhiza haematococci]